MFLAHVMLALSARNISGEKEKGYPPLFLKYFNLYYPHTPLKGG
jgi:hypothetical protein